MNFLGLLTPFTALVLYFSYNNHPIFASCAFIVMALLALAEILASHRPSRVESATFSSALSLGAGAGPTAKGNIS